MNEAKADKIELWGVADSKEVNINSKVSGRVVELLVDDSIEIRRQIS